MDTLDFDMKEIEHVLENPTNEAFDSLRNSGNKVINYIDSISKVRIKVIDKKSFTNNEIDLKLNDVVYTFSDGYIDQFGGEKNRKFMIRNFKQMLININDKCMTEQKKILSKTFDDWCGSENNQIDDVLVVGIKII